MTIFDLNHVEIISQIKQIKGGNSSYASASNSGDSASAYSSVSTSDGTASAIVFASTSDVATLISPFTSSSIGLNTTVDMSIISVVL